VNNGLEGSGQKRWWYYVGNCFEGTEKTTKTLKFAGVPANAGIGHLPNTSQGRYRFGNDININNNDNNNIDNDYNDNNM
jgi:hypothetical protein